MTATEKRIESLKNFISNREDCVREDVFAPDDSEFDDIIAIQFDCRITDARTCLMTTALDCVAEAAGQFCGVIDCSIKGGWPCRYLEVSIDMRNDKYTLREAKNAIRSICGMLHCIDRCAYTH